jgi:chemotaxis protein MotB
MNRAIITLLSLFGLAAIGSTIYLWYENDQGKKEIAELLSYSTSLNEELTGASSENSQLSEEKAALLEKNSAQVAALDQAISRHKKELAVMIAEREKQKESLVTKHSQMMSDLNRTIDDQRVKISEMNGVITVQMENKILFPSGDAQVSLEGQKVLSKVAGGFAEIKDKRFRIEGHTDNVPINNQRFPSNWELSATRAANVLHVLLNSKEVSPALYEIVGRGEFHPVAPNNSEKGRAQNRRIEILLFPKLDNLLNKSID